MTSAATQPHERARPLAKGSVYPAKDLCSQCGQPVSLKIPADDNRERYVCDACGYVHYQNPNNVCGAILSRGEEILLCRRAIEPRYGLWTLPAGRIHMCPASGD